MANKQCSIARVVGSNVLVHALHIIVPDSGENRMFCCNHCRKHVTLVRYTETPYLNHFLHVGECDETYNTTTG